LPSYAEYLPSECLVHLIREAKRRGDDAARDALLPLPLARCDANLNAKVDGQIAGAVQLREDILGDFAELLAIDGSAEDRHELDFFEVTEGRVVSLGRRASFAEGTLNDSDGILYASATSTLLVFDR
jgi:hypothetical protein